MKEHLFNKKNLLKHFYKLHQLQVHSLCNNGVSELVRGTDKTDYDVITEPFDHEVHINILTFHHCN